MIENCLYVSLKDIIFSSLPTLFRLGIASSQDLGEGQKVSGLGLALALASQFFLSFDLISQ